jgi:hypothetical protein
MNDVRDRQFDYALNQIVILEKRCAYLEQLAEKALSKLGKPLWFHKQTWWADRLASERASVIRNRGGKA